MLILAPLIPASNLNEVQSLLANIAAALHKVQSLVDTELVNPQQKPHKKASSRAEVHKSVKPTPAPLNASHPFSVTCMTSERCASRSDCHCHVKKEDLPNVCPKTYAVTRRCIYCNLLLINQKWYYVPASTDEQQPGVRPMRFQLFPP